MVKTAYGLGCPKTAIADVFVEVLVFFPDFRHETIFLNISVSGKKEKNRLLLLRVALTLPALQDFLVQAPLLLTDIKCGEI